MNERKGVPRNVAIALGLAVMILSVGLAAAVLTIGEKDNAINQRNSEIANRDEMISVFSAQVGLLQSQIGELEEQYGLVEMPSNVTRIAEEMYVVIKESQTENRTLYLDPEKLYCKAIVLRGGENPFPWDLAYPNASIVFYFFEDIEDPAKTDNYSDLIIRMNPIVDNSDGKLKMVTVFFAEGGYEKLVYFRESLLYHYLDSDPASNYGIGTVDL